MTERESPPPSGQPSAPGDHEPPPRPSCAESPRALFDPLLTWAQQFQKWGELVDDCYKNTCHVAAEKKVLKMRCKQFNILALDLKEWADAVDKCFDKNCFPLHQDHVRPPMPPFEVELMEAVERPEAS